MTAIFFLIEKSDLDALRQEIRELRLVVESQQIQSTQWVASSDVPSYLGISRRTWQNYRDMKLIAFSQIGRKIWVNRSELDAFIESCCIQSQTSNRR